jgi:hypothetical protein
MAVGLKRPIEPPIFCVRLMHSSNAGILSMMQEEIASPPAATSYLTDFDAPADWHRLKQTRCPLIPFRAKRTISSIFMNTGPASKLVAPVE